MLALMQGVTSQNTTTDHTAPQAMPSDFSDAIFARRLRAVREASGMTQQELADAMAATGNKIHRSTIGKIESGDRPVTIGEAVQLAGILGVGLAELVTDTGQDEAHRARVEAQVKVRHLQHLAAKRDEQAREAQLVYQFTLESLREARQELAALGGELPPETAGGKDDQ
jgi:transcriptional regulator with XRE-family HTH domain